MAKAFAAAGCSRIAITDINKSTLEDTRRAISGLNPDATVHAIEGDISDPAFVKSFVNGVTTAFSRIDYSVQCAGILGAALRSHETPVEDFDRINNINYKGTWLTSRAALGQMIQQQHLPGHPKQRGAVVNIASQLGVIARPAAGMHPLNLKQKDRTRCSLSISAAYCASKSAIINMTRSDAIDYSRDDVRVNCVCPGVIATPMTTGGKEVEERLRPAIDIAPMRRMGTPEEVADAVLFLCSSQASFVQGHALVVDGGYTIN